MSTLHLDNLGFVVRQDGSSIIFEQKRTRTPATVAMILGGITFILGVNAVMWTAMGASSGDSEQLLVGAVALVLSLIPGYVTYRSFRTWRQRSSEPESALLVAVLDGAQGSLIIGGRAVAPLSQVRFETAFDPFDSVQGLMRFLKLIWPGGELRVYKSGSGSELDALIQRLHAFCNG